jgi:hypothetical protein
MPVFVVDDGGDGSQTDSTQSLTTLDWAKAHVSFAALTASHATALTANGNTIFVGHNHVDQETYATARTFTLPSAAGAPVRIISVTQGTSTPTYQASTTNQIDTAKDGAFAITFDGGFSMHGIRVVSGAGITLSADNNEVGYAKDCVFALGANAALVMVGVSYGGANLHSCTIDLTADGTTARTAPVCESGVASGSKQKIHGMTFVNPGFRTGGVFGSNANMEVSGVDFSVFDNGTLCEPAIRTAGELRFIGCKLSSGQVAQAVQTGGYGDNFNANISFVRCSSGDEPWRVIERSGVGTLTTSATVYRNDGATVSGQAISWAAVGDVYTVEPLPHFSPWVYFDCAAGSKTFTVHVAHNAQGSGAGSDLTDAECWLEVEYMATSGSPQYTFKSDQRNGGTASAGNLGPTQAATVQTDDTDSTWTGSPGSNLQKLIVTATVGQAGMCRARVAVAKQYATVYIDPLITVT